ncbi:MAG TPA: alpha-glucan family phosphorylase [Gemmatales bacterium]|nr:alpha-glucan family phosphorylase [Gemmatales bacterium]
MPELRFRTFTVIPQLPERLQSLRVIAYNLWWTWHHEAVALFRRMDEELFEALDHSPVKLLGAIDQGRLEQLSRDDGFLAHLDRVVAALDGYLNSPGWYLNTRKDHTMRIAYFSMEFGIHESVPVYSGGLGVLAGDHLKSASDLGMPLVGVGLMYRQGYFRQYLNLDGWQQETFPENDFYTLPLISETDENGVPLTVSVPLPGRDVLARVWRLQVGRVPLYLLDTNLLQNRPEDREITGQLYGGDQEMRIKQEIVLGIGGYRALRALKKVPTVCHMNEGHSAFLGLERIRVCMENYNLSFAEARELVTAGNAFTTHTPVPAGNDSFPPHMIEQYLGYYASLFKIDRNELLALGRQRPADNAEFFGMTVLALRLSNSSNGVSKLHGTVSRKMWSGLWPDLPETDVPIGSVSNGVHMAGWLAQEMTTLLERHLGTAFWEKPTDHRVWRKVDNISDAELWRCHERAREQLVGYTRRKVRLQLTKRGASAAEIAKAADILDPEALTIGFARRSATYKRGALILRDLDRLAKILNNKDRPVQIIFAGKAHPHDKGGKELIQRMAQVARMPEFRRRIVFLEDYDIQVCRWMVHGCDIWLNNPRRPLEASGTSGMKVVMNGGLHLSILDGWWAEGYSQDNGFAIGSGEEYADLNQQDEIENRALYELLEKEIIPLYYARAEDGVPRSWMRMVKQSLKTLCPVFNTNRMVEEYFRNAYVPAHERYAKLRERDAVPVKEFTAWKSKVAQTWPRISVDAVEAPDLDRVELGHAVRVQARIQLAGLDPDEVEVQLYHGVVGSMGQVTQPEVTPMRLEQKLDFGAAVFAGAFNCRHAGRYGYIIRVLPRHPLQASSFTSGLVVMG